MMDEAIAAEPFTIATSRNFPDWLSGLRSAIAFTTYQTGKLFLLGVKPNGRLSLVGRSFPRSMGLAVSDNGRRLAMATEYSIQTFDNIVPEGELGRDGFDAIYAPHAAWVTGDIDAHDMAWDENERPVFVNTLFGCIATVSERHSFKAIWKPPFISRLAPEDRCHLNGLAMEDGKPRYVTAVSRSDAADGWRDRRQEGGVVVDVASGEIAAEGLSMPHSPRLYRGKLWLLNSGSGDFGFIDLATGRLEPVAFCPGFSRGLAFIGDYAVIGLSLPRSNSSFSGLKLDEALRSRDVEPRCGLAVVDITNGDMVEWVRLGGIVRELFDVAPLPGIRQPSAIGFRKGEVRQEFTIEA